MDRQMWEKIGRKPTKKQLTNYRFLVFNHPRGVNSPFTNEHINIKYHRKGKVKTKKVIKTPIAYLQNN